MLSPGVARSTADPAALAHFLFPLFFRISHFTFPPPFYSLTFFLPISIFLLLPNTLWTWTTGDYNTHTRHGLHLWGPRKNLAIHNSSLRLLSSLVKRQTSLAHTLPPLQILRPLHHNSTSQALYEHRILLEILPAHTFRGMAQHKYTVGMGVSRRGILNKRIAEIIRSLRLFDIVKVGNISSMFVFTFPLPGSDGPRFKIPRIGLVPWLASTLSLCCRPPFEYARPEECISCSHRIWMVKFPPHLKSHPILPLPLPKHTRAPDGFSPVAQIDWTTARER